MVILQAEDTPSRLRGGPALGFILLNNVICNLDENVAVNLVRFTSDARLK